MQGQLLSLNIVSLNSCKQKRSSNVNSWSMIIIYNDFLYASIAFALFQYLQFAINYGAYEHDISIHFEWYSAYLVNWKSWQVAQEESATVSLSAGHKITFFNVICFAICNGLRWGYTYWTTYWPRWIFLESFEFQFERWPFFALLSSRKSTIKWDDLNPWL